jgi:radical SAM protein with 4Fe4S-binding SPASM domain
LDFLHVSIDGYEDVHDRFRGAKTYRRILRNYLKVREKFKGITVAKITVTPCMRIEKAVLNLIDKFDYVYWQLESSPELENSENFQKSYDEGLNHLIEYWISEMKMGIVKGIVPFQIVIASLLNMRNVKGFPCGVGKDLIVIDVDGTCYLCDELMEEDYKIGSVIDGFRFTNKLTNENYEKFCKNCDFLYICGGGCFKASLKSSSKEFKSYCNLTRLLIQKLIRKLPEIKKLLSNDTIRKAAFNVNCHVEEIP